MPPQSNPPALPIPRMLPVDPIDRIEPEDPIDRTDPADPTDATDPAEARLAKDNAEPADTADRAEPREHHDRTDHHDDRDRTDRAITRNANAAVEQPGSVVEARPIARCRRPSPGRSSAQNDAGSELRARGLTPAGRPDRWRTTTMWRSAFNRWVMPSGVLAAAWLETGASNRPSTPLTPLVGSWIRAAGRAASDDQGRVVLVEDLQ